MFTVLGGPERHLRENYFTNGLAYLLPTGARESLLASDINSAISLADCTGSPNVSKVLSSTTAGLALHDAWEQPSQKPQHTHYTNSGVTRIDRIYIYIQGVTGGTGQTSGGCSLC